MDATWTIGILCVGIIVVVGGILALRLHAFLALTFGARQLRWYMQPHHD